MRVSASSVINSVADTSATPKRYRVGRAESEHMGESVPSGVLTPVLRPAFIAASIAWALVLPLAPAIAARAQATPIEGGFLLAVYAIGSGICHQRPERSFFLWSHQMPVCARCAGIYFGAAIAALVAITLPPLKGWPTTGGEGRPTTAGAMGPRVSARVWRAILVAASLPTAASIFYEWITGDMPSHWVRAATGLPLGAAIAATVVSALAPLRRGADD